MFTTVVIVGKVVLGTTGTTGGLLIFVVCPSKVARVTGGHLCVQWLCVSFGAISEVLVAGPSLLGMACNLGDSLPQAIAVALPCAAQRPLEAVASPRPHSLTCSPRSPRGSFSGCR